MPSAKKTSSKKSTGGKTASKKAPRTDAIALLTQDHEEVSALFEEYEELADDEADASDRQALAEQICNMLTVHATIEEEIFYPAARESDVESDLLDEAEVEHASAKDLIAQIRAMSPEDDLYDAKVKVLGEYVNHHVEEEEGEMFPQCKKAKMDLESLGAEIESRKAELMAEQEEEAV